MLSDANIPGKGNKIRMAWADKASMMLRKVLKLKRWQNLQTVMRVKCHGITSFTPSSSSAVSNGWQISLTKRTTRVLHRAWRVPRFQKGSEQRSVTFHIISHLTSAGNFMKRWLRFKVSSLQSLGLPSLHLAGVASFHIVSPSFRVFQRIFAHLKADQAAHLRCTEAWHMFDELREKLWGLAQNHNSQVNCTLRHPASNHSEWRNLFGMPRQHISTRLCNAYLFHQTEAALQVKLGERVANCAQCTICLEFCCEREDVILKNQPEAPARPISAKFGVFLLASASGCPSYHLPLCVFPQCYTFYMSRQVAYAFQVSYHITSKETPIFAGPTAAAKPPSDFDGSSRLTRQGSSHRLRLQCSKQVHIYVKHVMRWCEMWRERQRVQRGKKANNVSDCLMCASQKKCKFSQKLGQNNPYQHSKSFQGSLSGVRVSMIFARPCS